MDEKTVFEELMKEVPDFKSVFDEHKDYYEELLPHVLMGDFTRFLIDSYRKGAGGEAGSEHHLDVTRTSLEVMERAMSSSDPNLQELVSVSFLENLDQSDAAYEGIKALLGPNLIRQLAEYES